MTEASHGNTQKLTRRSQEQGDALELGSSHQQTLPLLSGSVMRYLGLISVKPLIESNTHPSSHPSIYPSVRAYVIIYPSTHHPCMYLSVHLFFCPSITCLSIHPFVHLSIHHLLTDLPSIHLPNIY